MYSSDRDEKRRVEVIKWIKDEYIYMYVCVFRVRFTVFMIYICVRVCVLKIKGLGAYRSASTTPARRGTLRGFQPRHCLGHVTPEPQ